MATKFGTQRTVVAMTHFFEGKRTNTLKVLANDPYLKDGKYLKSGSVTIMNIKHGETDQTNAIKLTFSEMCEVYARFGKEIIEQIEKEKSLS